MPTKNTELKLPNENPTTPEAKKANANEFIRQMVGLPKKAKEEKVAPKPGDKTDEEKAAEKTVADAAALKAQPKRKNTPKPQPAAPSLNAEDIASAVTAGVREAVKRDEPKAPKLDDGLSDDDRDQLAIINKMAEKNPAHKELPKRFADSLRKVKEYQKEWEAKNAGKKFNIADEEHSDFVEANNVEYDPREYAKAERELIKDEVAGDVRKEFTEKLSKFERAELNRKETPLVYQQQAASARMLFKELGDDFGKVLDEVGNINGVEIKRLCDENPIYEKVFPLAKQVEEVSGELLRIARGHVDVDENNPLHREIIGYATKQEGIFAKLPDDQKLNQHGQIFTTSDQWAKMSKGQQAKHWVLTDRDFASLYAMDSALAAKKIIEGEEGQFKALAEKRGYKPGEAAPKKDDPKPEEQPTERRSPPPSTVAPRMAPIQKPGENGKKTNAQILLGR